MGFVLLAAAVVANTCTALSRPLVRSALAGGVATALALGSFGVMPSPAAAAADEDGAAFIVVDQEDEIHFVEWGVEDSEIAGSVTVFTPSLDDPAGGTEERHEITGFIIGDSVALRFPDGFVATGAVRDGDLVLSWPDEAGDYYDITYGASTRSEYAAKLRVHADAAADQAIRIAQARLLEEFAGEVDDSLDELTRMSRTLAEVRPVPTSLERVLDSMERALEEATPAQLGEWDGEPGSEAIEGRFRDDFAGPYERVFCQSNSFAPDGAYATRLAREASYIEWALGTLRHRIDWLEWTLAENGSIETDRVDPLSARRRADESEADIVRAIADWRSAVEEAITVRDAATDVFATARSRFEQAGSTVPDCTPVTWAPGASESLFAGSQAQAGQAAPASATGQRTPAQVVETTSVLVGDVRCLDLASARDHLSAQGLGIGVTSPDDSPPADSWTVHEQLPDPGQSVPVGGTVDLVVMDPLEPCLVP